MASASIEISLPVLDLAAAPVGTELTLTFDPSDPFAVHLALEPDALTSESAQLSWVIERLELAKGLLGPVGEGLVRVVPFSSHAGHFLSIELASEDALDTPPHVIVIEAIGLVGFLSTASMFVPLGTELEHVDLDAELNTLLEN